MRTVSVEQQNARNAMMSELVSSYGPRVSRQTILDLSKKHGVNTTFVAQLTSNAIERGIYDVSSFGTFSNAPVSYNGAATAVSPVRVSTLEAEISDEDILVEQRTRFGTLDRMIDGVISGAVRSLIVSGPAGIGKTYRVELALESAHDNEQIQYTAIRGFVKATGLFKLLWENRDPGQILLLDDSDAAFQDDVALNLLKAALDTSVKRTISWRSEKNFVDEVGDEIPKTFDYKGSIIFITNLNFVKLIEGGRNLAPHLSALVDRSFYLDLNIKTQRECMLRIFDVLDRSDIASTLCLSEIQVETIKSFIRKYYSRFNGISLRTVLKLGQIIHFSTSTEDFENVALATCVKQ